MLYTVKPTQEKFQQIYCAWAGFNAGDTDKCWERTNADRGTKILIKSHFICNLLKVLKISKSILPRNPHGTHPLLSKKQVNWFFASVGPWPILLKVLLWSWPGGEVNSEFTPSSDPLSTPYCPIHINPYCPLRPEPPNKFKLLENRIPDASV